MTAAAYRRKLKPLSSDFTVVVDHRETGNGKVPWRWLEQDFQVQWRDAETGKKLYLETGDYSIKGYEKKVALEHKSGIAELYKDLVASYRPTFTRFLQRMSAMQVKAIIVEDPLLDKLSLFEVVAKTVRNIKYRSNGKSQLTEDTAWHWIGRIQAEFGVPIVFCDRRSVRPLATQWLMHAYQQVRR